MIPRFIAALLKGDQPTIYGDGSQSRDFTYIDNVVEANMLAASAPGVSGRVYNAACGDSLDLVTLLRLICESLNVPFAPYFAPPRVGDIQHSWADISAAVRDLGYSNNVWIMVSMMDGGRYLTPAIYLKGDIRANIPYEDDCVG